MGDFIRQPSQTTSFLLLSADHQQEVRPLPIDRKTAHQPDRPPCAGTTLVELVVAIAMLTLVMGAIMPLFAHIRRSWDVWQNTSETVQNGRVLIDHMHRTLATATRITAVSNSSESSGYIEFVDNDGTTLRYEIGTGNYVEFGEPGSLALLAGPVSQLQFTCYDDTDLSTAITDVNAIRYVKVQSTVVNAGAEGTNRVFTTSAYLRANGLPGSIDTVTQGTPYEYDSTDGKEPALAQIDSTHYLCAYRGDDYDGWAVVLTIDSGAWTVTDGTPLEFDTSHAHDPALTQIDTTHYLCAYRADDSDGWATILTVDTDAWTVTTGTAFEFDTVQGETPALSRIDSSHHLCVYAGADDDGWAVVLTTDPQVAHWKFDEAAGTSAADATGNGHTGTLNNMSGSEWTTGTVDGALEFDGTNDYVEMTSNSALQLTSALTIAGWIKCDIWGSGADVDIVLRKGTSSPVNYQLAIVDRKVTLMLDAWEYSGAIGGDTTLNTGQWYHVAATWDGAYVRIYLDGVLDNSPPDARSGTIGTDTRPLYIGGRIGEDCLDGIIDDVRLYAEALSATDILALTKPFSFREFTEAKASTDTTSVTLAIPGGTMIGDLLISAVATDGDTDASLAPPAGEGWTEINTNSSSSEVTLGAWWKLAGASESSTHQFTWSGAEQAYGWMMRFTGHDATSPINAFAANYGTSSTPLSPAVNASVNDAIILRLGGFDEIDITTDSPGLSGHTAITMDSSTGNVTIESTTISEATSATQTFVVSMPSTRPDGELYVAQIVTENSEAIDQVPSGWTEITDGQMVNNVRLASYWKIGSSEPSTYTWASDASCRWVGAIHRISGINTSSPINDSGSGVGNSASPTAPSVTTNVDNCLILRVFAAKDNAQASTYWPTGTTAIFQEDSAGSVLTAAAYETQVTSGTTGSAAFSMTATKKWVGATIAVAPASGAASVSGGAGYVRQSNSGSSGTSTFALTATEEARMVTIAVAPGSPGSALSKVLKKTPYEFDSSNGETPALARIDSTHYLCAYTGDGDDGWATVLVVDAGTWDVTQRPSYEFDNVKGKEPALTEIDSTHYLCAYSGDGDDGWAVVLTINTSSWTISKETAHEFDTVQGKSPALTQIDSTHYLCAYAGDGDDGWAVILTVDTNNWTITSGAAFEFDSEKGKTPALERINSSHHLCVYEGKDNDGWSVVLIPSSGTILP